MTQGGTYPDRSTQRVFPIEVSNVRTNVVRLWPSKKQHKILKKLANTCAKLWNEINYERRQQFFNGQKVDFVDTWQKYYEKYKHILKVSTQAVLQMNNEAWRSFFELLRLKKEGKLPPFMKKISPPGYWKNREFGKRELILVIRQDRYYIDIRNKVIVLKDWGLKISFSGKLRWAGKQGRLVIKFINGTWYAYIPVYVGEKPKKSNPKGYIHGELNKIQLFNPKGNLDVAIDPGLNNLFTVVTSNGDVFIYRGRVIKSEYFYWMNEISTVQSIRDWLRKKLPNSSWIWFYTKEILRLYELLNRRITHLCRNAISHLAKLLWELGVRRVFIGYPKGVVQENGNVYTVNMWRYRWIIFELARTLQLYGIKTYAYIEYDSSITCSRCGNIDFNSRIFRGLYKCRKCGLTINADVNAALNILKACTGKTPKTLKKIKTFIITHNGVKPIIPHQRDNSHRPRE